MQPSGVVDVAQKAHSLVRVAVLEDGAIARAGIVAQLERDPGIKVVGATEDPDQLITWAEAGECDVAIVDLKIKDDRSIGIQVIKRISDRVACLVVTSFPKLAYFLAARRAGARGFARKDAADADAPPLRELVRRLHDNPGYRYWDDEVVERLADALSPKDQPRQTVRGRANEPLTDREKQVLKAITEGKTNSKIAAELFVSINTVKTHVQTVLQKLGVHDRNDAVLILHAMDLEDEDQDDG